jgi:hypothetical protein
MTERTASATATATATASATATATASASATTGVLHFVQDDEIDGEVILRLWVRWLWVAEVVG